MAHVSSVRGLGSTPSYRLSSVPNWSNNELLAYEATSVEVDKQDALRICLWQQPNLLNNWCLVRKNDLG